MTTYGELQAKVADAIGDAGNDTFPVATVKSMISAAWAEVGDIAPERFQEDITPLTDTAEYQLRTSLFTDPVDEIEPLRVEVWDVSATPHRAWRQVEAQSAHPTGLAYSQAGWTFWGGILALPDRVVNMIDVTAHMIRVWGYSPWAPVSDDADVLPFGRLLEEAMIQYCHVEALRRLVGDRVLFTQWQTRSNNTDVSLAGLNSDLAQAQQSWERKARRIAVLREKP